MPARKTPGKPKPRKRTPKRTSKRTPLYGFVPSQPSQPPRRGSRKWLEDAVATLSIETEVNDWYEE